MALDARQHPQEDQAEDRPILQDENGSNRETPDRCCITCLIVVLALSAAVFFGSFYAEDVYLDTAGPPVCMGPHNTQMIYTPRFPKNQTLSDPRQRLELLLNVTGRIWVIDHYADRLPEDPSLLRPSGCGDDCSDPVIRAADWLVHQDTTDIQDHLIQRFALAVIYMSLGGNHWKNKTNWLDTKEPVCNWYGITCCTDPQMDICDKDAMDMVVSVDLSRNHLVGTFSEAWILLSELRSIRLNDNRVSGGFWGFSFGNLPYLRSAYLQNNRLTGEINSDSIVDSESLDTLHLYGNDFIGPVPYKMCRKQGGGGPAIRDLVVDCDRNLCQCCRESAHCYKSRATTS